MKQAIFLLLLCSCYLLVSGQKETSQWFLHNNNRIQFNAGGPVSMAGPNAGNAGSNTSLCDAQGNLLFACYGSVIVNRNLVPMPALNNNAITGGDETIIAVAVPGSTSKYYLFYSSNIGDAASPLQYSIIDMSLDGGLGDVTTINAVVANDVSVGFTIVQQPGSGNFWIVTNEYRTTNFRSYLVTAAGISNTPVISVAGSNQITTEYRFIDLRASPDGKMIAGYCSTYYPGGIWSIAAGYIEAFNFDGATGVVTNKVKSTKFGYVYTARGNIEFSPDSRLLYFLERYIVGGLQPCGFGSSTLRQFNLCYTDSVEFTRNAVYAGSSFSFCTLVTHGRMQLGPDKKIYIPYSGGSMLSTVDSPNIIGTSGRMNFNGFSLPSNAGNATPGFYHQYLARAVRNNIVYTGNCHPAPLSFKVTNDTIHAITWDFGDPASGGNNASTQLTPQHAFSTPGIYTVTARLYNTASQLIETVTVPVEIKDPQRRLLADYPTDTTFCGGNEFRLKLKVINGIFKWSKKEPGYPLYTLETKDSIIITSSGKYYVEMLQNDCAGCKMIDSIDVTVLPVPYFDLGYDRNLCTGDSLQLNIYNTGATYLWSTGATTPSIWIKQPGTYWGKAELNNNGCPKSDTIVITGIPGVQFSLPNDTTLCNNDQLILKPGISPASYYWQNGTSLDNFTVQQPGKYWVRVTAPNGCIKSDTISVAYVNAQTVRLGADTALCTGDNLVLSATTAGAQYLWSTGATADNITVTQTGDYWVHVNTGLCTVKDTIAVAFNAKPLFDLGPDSILCDGSTLVLKPGIDNATYLWQDNTTADTLLIAQPGLYEVKVTRLGCSVSDDIRVNYKPLPVVQLGRDTSICVNSQLMVNATHASIATYLWQDGVTTATRAITQPGQYWLKGTGFNGCVKYDTLALGSIPLPSFQLGKDTALCNGQALQLSGAVAGAASYSWNTGSTQSQLTVNAPGDYWLKVIQQGCSKSDTIAVSYKPLPIIELGNDTMLCPGATLMLDASFPGATYQWQDQSAQPQFLVNKAGEYVVTTILNNCSFNEAIKVTYGAIPFINLGRDSTICAGQVLVLSPRVNNAQLLWPDGSNTPQFVVKEPGTYAVTATNLCGVDHHEIVVHKGYCQLAMPNAFTPNGDHNNDVFKVNNPTSIKDFYMVVYNRWGQKVFETTNATTGWDGRFKNIDQPPGNYIWVIQLTDIEGRKVAEKGVVQLIK